MNQPLPHFPPSQLQSQSAEEDEDTIDLVSYLDFLVDHRWLIGAIAALVTLLGAAYVFIATPVYQANIMVQVEDSANSSKNILGDLSSVFDLKAATTAEMEILRSRYVVSRAVQNRRLYIEARPKYFPLIGKALARRSKQLSEPGVAGLSILRGYVWGTEQAQVSLFDVPEPLENQPFTLTAEGGQRYRLVQDDAGIDIVGNVGETITRQSELGTLSLRIGRLAAKPGAQFILRRAPITQTVDELQEKLAISEKGKQSGIIAVSLEGTDPKETTATLNEIGREYVRQNVERKSEEAEKSLAFLDKQLPELKANLEQAEAEYNSARNSRGTVDLSEEAKAVLQQSVLSQTSLVELKQKRDELLTRFQPENPMVQAVNQQIRTVNNQIEAINKRIKRMPAVEQDVFRLTRDVKVSTDLYTTLLNSAQQLRLVKASKVGNARLLDTAVQPLKPVRPKKLMVMALAALIGLFLGLVGAFIRKSLFGGIDDPHQIEVRLGLTVSATVPHSAAQEKLYAQIKNKVKNRLLLAHDAPSDQAIESLRSFRTSLQFSMLSAKNNIVMITGPTPEVGKSFISVNFAAVLAATGKKILLIDGDLRKGQLHRYFGLERNHGLSEAIAGRLDIEEALHRNLVDGLDFLATGVLPPRPAEMLAHRHFGETLQELSARYDIIVIDTAPVLAVSDAQIVAPQAGTIFNVVRGGLSTIGEIEEAVKRFNQAGIVITGVVFNDLKPRSGRYGYGSKYGRYRYAQYQY